MATNIHYVLGKDDLLDSVNTLWQELNKLHFEKSPYHKDYYANNTFEARKESLLATARNGRLCIMLACDADVIVGYCIASIVDDAGEIDSLFVSNNYRRMGIAGNLMDKALDWLKRDNAKKIAIKVSVGNEDVVGFYAKFGFYPCLTELQKRP